MSKKQNISNIHDKFFKENFSKKEIVAEFLQTVFPETLKVAIDFSTLELSNTSFVDEELAENFADLVYLVDYKGNTKIQISLLLEHKSFKDDYPHLQLMRYMLNSWQQNIKQKQPLLLTIPVIIYHGKGEWKYQKFQSYFNNIDEIIYPFIPEFDYLLVNLSELSDEKIMGFQNKFLALSTLLMKNSHRKKYLMSILDKFETIVKEIENHSDLRIIRSSFLYVFQTENLTIPELLAIFTDISPKVSQEAMTTAEQLIEKGLEKGIEQATVSFVKKLLKIGMDAETIAVTFDLPLKNVLRIIEQLHKA